MSTNRRDRHQEEIRMALMESALQLILEQGYDAVTVAAITHRADYGRSTFYQYFQDKEDLVWAILQHHMIVLDQRITAAIASLQSPEREWVSWNMLFEDIDRQRPFFLKMDGELSRKLRQMQKDALITGFEQQLQSGLYSLLLEDIPHEIEARYVVGALLEILDYWLQVPEAGDARTMAGYLFRLVFRKEPPEHEP